MTSLFWQGGDGDCKDSRPSKQDNQGGSKKEETQLGDLPCFKSVDEKAVLVIFVAAFGV